MGQVAELGILAGTRVVKYLACTLVAIGILNFASYVIVALSLGGDAVNGKTEGGRFYLCEHGHYTEVSRSVFEYSRYHTYSVWVTHPLAMSGGYFLYREKQNKKKRRAAMR